jgi:L-aminopeptidase/D-esterase-like protein
MLNSIEGVRVGHWTDSDAQTGCTVVLLPEGNVTSGEVRGGAPATRDFELLHPDRMLTQVDAVMLTGGSAFGLAAADGVSQWCEAQGRGFTTAAGPVPIVVAMALFDLGTGDPTVRPGAEQGQAAANAAHDGEIELGRVGAGTGATIDKWRGADVARPGGLGGAVATSDGLSVAALVAVNAAGGINDGSVQASIADGTFEPPDLDDAARFTNTTVGVVATNAILTKGQCHLVAQSAHDGLARALFPAHTQGDGDAMVAAATGAVEAQPWLVRVLAAAAVEEAIRSACS